MHEPTQPGATNISQDNDYELINEYKGDDYNQGDYSIVNNDGILTFSSFKKLIYYYLYICTNDDIIITPD